MIERYSVSVICFSIAIVCLLYVWIKKRDFFQPVVVYIFAQTMTMGIAYFKLLYPMTDLGMLTWTVWVGALISFSVGTGVFYAVFYRNHQPIYEFEKPAPLWEYNWKLHFFISIFLLLLFLAGSAIVISKIGFSFLNFFGEKSSSNGGEYGMFGAIAFNSSPLVVLFFAVASFKSINPHAWIRRLSFALALAVPLFSILVYPGRLAFFTSVGSVAIMYNYIKRRIAPGLIVLAMALAISSFLGIAIVRDQYGSTGVKGMVAKQVATLPYKYIANNYWNLDYGINTLPDRQRHQFTYGIDVLNGPLGMFRFSGSIREMMGWDNEFNKSVEKIYGLNTVNYLWETYKDFGVAGCIVVPFVAAFLMAFMYESVKRRKSPFWWMLYGISMFFVGWSFFITGYKLLHVWIWVYIIALSTWCCSRKTKRLRCR